MERINKKNVEDLSSVLDDLSFSYMMLNSTKEELEDLDQSIKELKNLVDFLEDPA